MAGDGKHDWQFIKKGDQIPANAVKAGETSSDGPTYVGRYKGEARISCFFLGVSQLVHGFSCE